MSEAKYKRRLRAAKRRIVTNLTLAGYEAYSYDTGPFHVCADSPFDSRRIRIVFGECDSRDVKPVLEATLAGNVRREIWQLSDDGRTWVVVKVTPKGKNPY